METNEEEPEMASFFLAAEKTVVLDVGSATIKAGFAGEAYPRTEVRRKSEQGGWSAHDAARVFRDIFFTALGGKPSDHRVIVCEHTDALENQRNAIAVALLKILRVSGVHFIGCAPAALYASSAALNRSLTALVVDCGEAETRVVPILHGTVLRHANTVIPLGVANVRAAMLEAMPNIEVAEEEEETLRDITMQASLVSPNRDIRGVTAFQYAGKDGACVAVSPEVRVLAGTTLFNRDDEFSVVTAVESAIAKAPMSFRRLLASSILLTGAGPCIPGFAARLERDLRSSTALSAARSACIINHDYPSPALHAWAGAGVLSLTMPSALFVSKDDLEKHRWKLPSPSEVATAHLKRMSGSSQRREKGKDKKNVKNRSARRTAFVLS